ncbi:MAG: glycosyltransferase [Streptosporangiaceae bacterium]
MSSTNPHGKHVVTAVIVAHDGAAWLPRIAEALLGQTRPVQRVVAVDTGSRDRSGAVLAELLGRSVVSGMDRRAGYGAAVAQALKHRAASTNVPGPAGLAPGERTEWIWLLHDDSEPASDALEQLLRGAAEVRTAAVLGPKVMDWSDRRVLLETGVTIDTAGRRITGIEPREVDQGQHDGDRDVLAVGSAGLLVRRDVWEQLGGFDPAMPLFRDDIDFCWRVHSAGHRVRVITDAVVYHLEATARNRRAATAAPRPRRMDRHNALLTLLGNLPLRPAMAALAGNLVLSALRTLFFLLAKRPRAALDEFAAVGSILAHPVTLLGMRRQRARGRRAAYGKLRSDLPRGRSLRRLAEFAASVFYSSTQIDTAGSHHATDDPDEDEYLLTDTGVAQRILTNPGVLLFAALTAVTVAAERSIITAGTLTGGAITPAFGGASALWHEYLQSFHPAGIGSASGTPPYVALTAALATVLGGKPWLAIDAMLIGCVPVAGLTAYFAARRVTASVWARVWAGAAYALLPVGMGAVAAGRFGAAVVFALLPLIGMLAARIFTAPARRARRAAWATGLFLAVAAAFVPLVWLAAVAAAVLAAVTLGRSRRGTIINLGIAVVTPAVLLLPWTLQAATQPGLLFLEAGQKVPGLATAGLPARSLLLLSPGGPGLPPFWVTSGLALAALAALLLTARRSVVLAGWSVALLGLLTAVAVSRVLVTPDGATRPVVAWPGIALAVAAAGLLLAVLVAADGLPGQLGGGRWRRPAGLGVALLAAAAVSAPLLAAGAWLTTGVRGPVTASSGPVLPAFVSVSADTGLRLRTLVLRQGPAGVTFEVLRDSDPLIGAGDLSQPPAAQRALASAVSTLVAPDGGDARDQGQALAALGIGYVLLPAPVSGSLAGTLNNVAALRPVSKTGTFQLWRVAVITAQARVIEPDGTVVPVAAQQVGVSGAAAPRSGGTLVLAEPAGGWSATLNGAALPPVAPVDGWAQAFRLPPGGGTLDVSHSQLGRDLIVALEALAFLIVAVLALPGTRVAAESAAPTATPAEPAGRRERRAGSRGSRAADVPVAAMAAGGAAAAATAVSTAEPGRAATAVVSPGPGSTGLAGPEPAGSRAASTAVASTGLLGRSAAGRATPAGRGSRAAAHVAAAARTGRGPDQAGPEQDSGDGRSKRRPWRRGGKQPAEAAMAAGAALAEPPVPRQPGSADEYPGHPEGSSGGYPAQPGRGYFEEASGGYPVQGGYPEGSSGGYPAGTGEYPAAGRPGFPGGRPGPGDTGRRPRAGSPGAENPEPTRPSGRHVSRGRLPGDDDALPPPRRGRTREPDGYPDQGYPDPGYPDPGYPDQGYPDPGYPEAGRPGGSSGYPADAGELAPLPPASPGQPAGGRRGRDGGHPDDGGYPVAGRYGDTGGYPDLGGYPGHRAYPGQDDPDPEGVPAWGSEARDEPGEAEW